MANNSSHAPQLLPQSPQDSPVRSYNNSSMEKTHTHTHTLHPTAAAVTAAGAGTSPHGAPPAPPTPPHIALASAAWELEKQEQHAHTHNHQAHGHMSAAMAPALLQKFIFGLGASFGYNALIVANGTLMDYYEEKYGLSTSFLSLADFLTGSLTLYAVVGFGYLSDVTTGSWGRRKPFVVCFTPLLAFSVIMLFSPRWAPKGGNYVAAWFGVFYALEQTSISAMTVVIAAWGTSLTHAVNERASLYTIDAVMDLLGFLTGVFITAVGKPHNTGLALAFIFVVQNILLVRFLRDDPVGEHKNGASSSSSPPTITTTAPSGGATHTRTRDERESSLSTSSTATSTNNLTHTHSLSLSTTITRKQKHASYANVAVPFIPGLHLSLQNKQFMTLFAAAAFGSIVGTTVNLLPIFFQVVMSINDDAIERAYSIYVQLVVASAFITILSVNSLNARWGKIGTLKFGVGMGAFYGVLAFVTSYVNVRAFYLTSIPAGVCAGIVMVNGNVLLSNSIDYDELRTGFRRQSMYQCLIYVPMTFVSVAGSSIPLAIITAFGGLEAGRAPPLAVVQTLRLWLSLIVTGCLCVSYHQLSSLKLTEEVQEVVSTQLRRREEGEKVPPQDPLAELPVVVDGEPMMEQQQQHEGGGGGGGDVEMSVANRHNGGNNNNSRHSNQLSSSLGGSSIILGGTGGSGMSRVRFGGSDLEGASAAAPPSPPPSSSPAFTSTFALPCFLELNFSSRELALLTLDKGKQWKLGIYLLNLLASTLYAVLLLIEIVAAMEERNDLTSAEIFSCFFMLASGVAIYEGARFQAMKEVYYMGDDREVARWARRRLTARKDVRPALLQNPFAMVRRTIIGHVLLGIALLTVITSLPSPV